MLERFFGSPFKYPIVWRNFRPNHLGQDGSGQWTLREAEKVIRRLPLYSFKGDPIETVSRIKQVYGEFGSYPNLHVPHFDVIRGAFDHDDARLQPYLLVVDLIDGQNLRDINFRKSEREESKVDLELFLESLLDYAVNKISKGGYYPSDQLYAQYVYGRSPRNEKKGVYFVDLDPHFGFIDSDGNGVSSQEQAFTLFITMVGGLTQVLEAKLKSGQFTRVRKNYKEYLDSLIETGHPLAMKARQYKEALEVK